MLSGSSLGVLRELVAVAGMANGLAILLDWKYNPAKTRECTIDAYKNKVSDALNNDLARPRIRRHKHELWMLSSHHQYLLMQEWGYSRGEIKALMKEVQQALQCRV